MATSLKHLHCAMKSAKVWKQGGRDSIRRVLFKGRRLKWKERIAGATPGKEALGSGDQGKDGFVGCQGRTQQVAGAGLHEREA